MKSYRKELWFQVPERMGFLNITRDVNAAVLESGDPEFPGPIVGPFTEQRDIINASLEQLLLSGADPATVLADAEADVTEALQAYLDANF